MTPEFSRPIALDTLGETPRRVWIEANATERAALAERFGLLGIESLAAGLELRRDGDEVRATGRVTASVTQSCVASGAPVATAIDETVALLFRPLPTASPDEEVELGGSELDVAFYQGGAIDIGEAAAETLALALPPYPRAPDAEQALASAGVKSEAEAGPFAALAGLRDRLKP